MKTVFLIRHAKSSWAEDDQKDFDRPLNERGKKDAAAMAKKLFDKKISIDAFISSPAKRALTTCEYFTKAFGKNKKDIIREKRLYEATVNDFFEVMEAVNDDYNSVAIFAHNPTITAFANELTKIKVDDMPTCAIFALTAETQSWQGFEKANKTFLFFDYPKNNS